MTRGEVWTVAGGAARTGKPRPAVIVQDDRFDAGIDLQASPPAERRRYSGSPKQTRPAVWNLR